MNFSGEFQGRDSHFLMKGYAADMLIPSDKGIEMMTLGDNVYLHGPVPLLGAPESKWYVAKSSTLDRTRPLSRPTSWVGEYGSANWAGFKKGSVETLDGKPCDTYLGDKSATLAWYESANPQDIPDEDLFAAFDAADSKVWICSDSYLHKFSVTLTTHSKYDPKQKGTLQMLMHFFDINSNIQIAAPPNAVLLDLPQSTDDTF
jgi:hypothetical protein